MNPGPGNTEEHDAYAASSDQQGPSSRLTEIVDPAGETSAAVREQSDRPTSVDQPFPRESPGVVITPETKEQWESTVRRYTDSIDVRLDILEDDLGGLQEELERLRDVARERVDAAQRRLGRRFAIGQAVLGILIVVLFLAGRAGEDGDWAPHRSGDSLAELPATSGTDSAAASVARETTLSGDALIGVGDDAPSPAVPVSEPVTSAADAAASPAPPSPAPAEPVPPQSSTVPEPAQQSGGRSAPSPPVPPVAEDQQSATTNEPPPPVATSEHASNAAAQPAPQTVESEKAQQTAQASAQGEDGTVASEGAAAPTKDTKSNAEQGTEGTVLDEERFAVQLIAFESKSRVRPFVEKFGLGDTARYIHSRNQGSGRYLVLLGDYATRAKAKAAINATAPELRKLEPWIRSLPAGTRLIPTSSSGDVASD